MATRQPTTERAIKAAKENAPQVTTAKSPAPAADKDYWKKLNEKWAKEAKDAQTGELEGKITDIIPTPAGMVYGDKAKDAERPVLQLEITASDGKIFHEAFSQPEGAGSWRNSKFKLGQFLARYGVLPSIGLPVKIGFDTDGFYKLII